jgi:hypothetical protein
LKVRHVVDVADRLKIAERYGGIHCAYGCAGRGVQAGGLDPVHYYISSMFTQVLVWSVTLIVAPLIDRTSAVSWLGSLGGVVVIKFLLILWAATRTAQRSRIALV